MDNRPNNSIQKENVSEEKYDLTQLKEQLNDLIGMKEIKLKVEKLAIKLRT